MNKIIKKVELNSTVSRMRVYAPLIAEKAKAGQFIILRVSETGERIPLTIADTDIDEGSVTIIYQKVGKTTLRLDELQEGDTILDFVGPLGQPSKLSGYKKVAVIGGGVGTAIAFPVAKALHDQKSYVDMIVGFRNKELVILEKEMSEVSNKIFIMTDDGSNGNKGFVTDKLEKLLDEYKKLNEQYDLIVAIGPMPMMKAVSDLTKKYNIETRVSMNPIMIDGTGMCGGCRITVDGETKFACVDGPEFDAHKIDWDEAMVRASQYKRQERHACKLLEKQQ